MSEFDFEGALRSQVASQEETTPEPEPQEQEGHVLETDENLAPPEILAPQTAEAEEGAEEAEEEETEPELELDARSREYLSELAQQFGGDPAKALRNALDAQGMIGRQSTELGDLRKAVEALQANQGSAKAPVPFPGDLDEQIEENPGQVAQWALQENQPGIYEAAIRQWYEDDPRSAGRFERSLEMDYLRREMEESFKPVVGSVQQQTAARTMSQAQADLRVAYPDLDSVLESATEAEVQGLDASVIRQLQETNPKAALETIYRWVKAGRPAEAQQPVSPERQEAARAAKRDAAVVTASSTPAREEKGNYERLKDFMLEPDPQSVSHGLQR